MIFCFCLWRLYLEFKLTSINKLLSNKTLGLKDKVLLQEIDNSKGGRKSFVGFTPKLRSSNVGDAKFTIRMEE